MTTNSFKTEKTSAGLKIYIPFDESWIHVKTVKTKYESIIKDLSWIRDMKRILPTREEKFFLETKYIIHTTKFENKAIKDYVAQRYVRGVKILHKHRDADQYAMILDNGVEVLCSAALITMARKIGIEVQEVNRL